MTLTDQIAFFAAAVAVGSALVSILAVYVPWLNTHDSEVFREAALALERGYRALCTEMREDGHPVADRLNWLTAARHLESFKELKSRLKTKLYSRLCAEHEEHWRHEFYKVLLRERINHPSYYRDGKIEPRSALVIYEFMSWPEWREDRIDVLDVEAMYRNPKILPGNIGLSTYLADFAEYGRPPPPPSP